MLTKMIITGVSLISVVTFATATDCSTLTGCEKKICELQTKANALTEPHAKARVEAALAETKANCTDSGLAAHDKLESDEHTMKVNHKIEDAKDDIKEAERKKAEAQAEGKADKVRKYERKIEEKQLKIKHLEQDK